MMHYKIYPSKEQQLIKKINELQERLIHEKARGDYYLELYPGDLFWPDDAKKGREIPPLIRDRYLERARKKIEKEGFYW